MTTTTVFLYILVMGLINAYSSHGFHFQPLGVMREERLRVQGPALKVRKGT